MVILLVAKLFHLTRKLEQCAFKQSVVNKLMETENY